MPEGTQKVRLSITLSPEGHAAVLEAQAAWKRVGINLPVSGVIDALVLGAMSNAKK